MTDQTPVYELVRDIDHYLGLLSKIYKSNEEKCKLEIIVNAEVSIQGGWEYDNWNGGTSGHAIYLRIPQEMFIKNLTERDTLQSELIDDINKVHNVSNEYVCKVFIESMHDKNDDWRRNSGAIFWNHKLVLPSTTERIWGQSDYRVFLSHKTEVKCETAELKRCLQKFGIFAFVAHEDIHPTKEWQDEIESALETMDAFVALLTDKFHDSAWTDQEVGFAFCRNVPIIAVRLGMDPYGFIGKFQALSCDWSTAPVEIVKLLIPHEKYLNSYLSAVEKCSSFNDGNDLANILPTIETLSTEQEKRLVNAYNTNAEVSGSFGFSGSRPRTYGDGLPVHLKRITGNEYVFDREYKLVVRPQNLPPPKVF
jgi:hypothetical protein